MEQNNKPNPLKNILLAVMAALILFLVFRTATLSEEINHLKSNLSNISAQINNVHSDISSIYQNVDAQLKKEASLFSHLEYSLGELDTDTHTVDVELKAVPKMITENMELSVSFGGETVLFRQDGDTFTANLPVNMFMDYGELPLFCVETDSGRQTEYPENVDLSCLYRHYLPEIYANIGHNFNLNNGKLKLDSHFHISCKPTSVDSPVSFVKYELVTEVNGTEVARNDLTEQIEKDLRNGSVYDSQFQMTIDAKVGDVVVFYLLSEDSLGYIHKTTAFHWYEEDGAVAELMSMDGDRIYDKNGNLLTEQ